MNRVLNWKKGPVDDRDMLSKRHLSIPTELPYSFELDKQIPVYDQLDLGSCTANTGAVCFRYEAFQSVGNLEFLPSRLFLYYNTRLIEGTQNEDSGAYIRDVFKALNKSGICDEAHHPYIVSEYSTTPSKVAYDDGTKHMVVEYATVAQDLNLIKATLVSGAAISFGFNVYSSFFGSWSKSTGVMPLPKVGEKLEGGHAVTIVGYDNGRQCFLIQNSWGSDWALKGKFWMPYKFVLDNRECDDFWCIQKIQLIQDPVPTPEPVPVKNEVDWMFVGKDLFANASELNSIKKTTLVKLASNLKLDLTNKTLFRDIFQIVKQKLGL